MFRKILLKPKNILEKLKKRLLKKKNKNLNVKLCSKEIKKQFSETKKNKKIFYH